MGEIINIQEIAIASKRKIIEKINKIEKKLKLVVIQVGNDNASSIYVRNKEKLCYDMNIDFEHIKYEEVSEDILIKQIEELNNDTSVTSILVQLPLPSYLNAQKIIETINYKKDVDGLTSINVGKLISKEKAIIPCTALGIMQIFSYNNIDLAGKKVVIIGRTKLVGIPLITLFLNKNATVTICHSKTKMLEEHTKTADVLVVAVGSKYLINKDMIKENVIIIDVGINRINNKIYGDVNLPDVINKVSMITSVPGGVGILTVVMLINNILECYYLQK